MDLQNAAKRSMIAHGFVPDFPAGVQQQLATLRAAPPKATAGGEVRDLRSALWSSIDNETSKDLDQLEVALRLPDGTIKVAIALADVAAFVPKGSAIDDYAALETTSVYTGVRVFPMLPNELSTDTTSLIEGADKLCIVVEFVVDPGGKIEGTGVLYQAVVRNHARLTYDEVGAWLEGRGPVPANIATSQELQAQVKLQDEAAQLLRKERRRRGALNIETIEMRPILSHDQVVDIARQEKNRATELIEDFMIAANGIVAQALDDVPSIRRIVRTPKRWDRIVALAAEQGATLPTIADPRALNEFLVARKAADPDHFADLSLAVIKLMGPGEYVLEKPGDPSPGHFGLAVENYTHSTAPNRRYADLITQRLVKAQLAKQPMPYNEAELAAIAANCTLMEDAARKVEREMAKRIAAVAMTHRIGEQFDAIVTGVSPKGTFVRVLNPRVEGLLARGQAGVDVGDRLRVTLTRTDVEKGFIDFARI